MLRNLLLLFLLIYTCILLCTATPGSKTHIQADPNYVPLTPLKYKNGENKLETKYTENAILGEKRIFIEESFYLITSKTNLTVAYDYVSNMKTQISAIRNFMRNMTFFAKQLKIEQNSTLHALDAELANTLNLRVNVAEESLKDMCVPPKHVTDHNAPSHIRNKRGIFNPAGKVLNFLWGQGDPDEIQEMTDWFETHKDEDKRIIETQGDLLHLLKITNETMQAQQRFISNMNKMLLEEKSDLITLEVCLLSLARFQLIADALESFITRAKFQLANGKNKFLTRSAIPEDQLSDILRNITLETNFKPPFKVLNNYYNTPLSHVHEKNCMIRQTLILP